MELRYTLRLLTLDQLGRAATLICALETLRKLEGKKLGPERFSIGLWVGRSATANSIDQAADEITSFRLGRASSPCPLPACPWCKTELDAGTLRADPAGKPARIVIGCKNDLCDFSPAHDPNGLPVLFVDEEIYRELPCFVVGTVDKFAMLPSCSQPGRPARRAPSVGCSSKVAPFASISDARSISGPFARTIQCARRTLRRTIRRSASSTVPRATPACSSQSRRVNTSTGSSIARSSFQRWGMTASRSSESARRRKSSDG